jgi:hypothetical protein
MAREPGHAAPPALGLRVTLRPPATPADPPRVPPGIAALVSDLAYERSSTGFFAILLIGLLLRRRLTLYGFDFFAPGRPATISARRAARCGMSWPMSAGSPRRSCPPSRPGSGGSSSRPANPVPQCLEAAGLQPLERRLQRGRRAALQQLPGPDDGRAVQRLRLPGAAHRNRHLPRDTGEALLRRVHRVADILLDEARLLVAEQLRVLDADRRLQAGSSRSTRCSSVWSLVTSSQSFAARSASSGMASKAATQRRAASRAAGWAKFHRITPEFTSHRPAPAPGPWIMPIPACRAR